MATIEDILLAQGQQAGAARRARGGVWAPLIQQAGQIPQQIAADRAAGQERSYLQRMREQQMATGALEQQRTGLQLQQAQGALQDQSEERQARQIGAKNAAKLAEIISQPGVIDPETWKPNAKAAMEAAARLGYQNTTVDLMQALRGWDAEAAKMAATQADIAQKDRSNQPQPFTLTRGKRFDAEGNLIASVDETFEVTVPGPNGPVRKLVTAAELQQGVPEYRAPQQGAMPSFQAKEVLNDEGKPVMANFDARTGSYIDPSSGQPIQRPRPVPSATEASEARKFQTADPILRSVEDLSERINTYQGIIAKARGSVERAKAQANYNDDVAEYEALVSGFTPLVARALGHTGVLTQQDVDSVKALFPKPGDSKSLRDRKVSRIKLIIGDLQQQAQPPNQQASPAAGAAADPLGLGF